MHNKYNYKYNTILKPTTATRLVGAVLNPLDLWQILLILGTTYADLYYHWPENYSCHGMSQQMQGAYALTFSRRDYFFFNFSTPCIYNVNNTWTKYVRIMKQTAFWKEKKKERRVYNMFKIFSIYICWINI